MSLPGPIELCHLLLATIIEKGDVVVDATVGNGHDTVVLADLVGPDGLVYGFDVQQEAIERTHVRLAECGFEHRARLIQTGHENAVPLIDSYHHGRIRAVVFNLGYLPGGDKSIKTDTNSTIDALQRFTGVLCEGGLIALVIYRGHKGAADEALAVTNWCRRIDPVAFLVTSYGFVNRPNNPPYAILIQRRRT